MVPGLRAQATAFLLFVVSDLGFLRYNVIGSALVVVVGAIVQMLVGDPGGAGASPPRERFELPPWTLRGAALVRAVWPRQARACDVSATCSCSRAASRSRPDVGTTAVAELVRVRRVRARVRRGTGNAVSSRGLPRPTARAAVPRAVTATAGATTPGARVRARRARKRARKVIRSSACVRARARRAQPRASSVAPSIAPAPRAAGAWARATPTGGDSGDGPAVRASEGLSTVDAHRAYRRGEACRGKLGRS